MHKSSNQTPDDSGKIQTPDSDELLIGRVNSR